MEVNGWAVIFLQSLIQKKCSALSLIAHEYRWHQMPVKRLWQQIISDTNAKIIVTTCTAGAIGAKANLGDVVISKNVWFDCTRTFKNQPFGTETFISGNKLKIPKIFFIC